MYEIHGILREVEKGDYGIIRMADKRPHKKI